jgi:hypothetical protein
MDKHSSLMHLNASAKKLTLLNNIINFFFSITVTDKQSSLFCDLNDE